MIRRFHLLIFLFCAFSFAVGEEEVDTKKAVKPKKEKSHILIPQKDILKRIEELEKKVQQQQKKIDKLESALKSVKKVKEKKPEGWARIEDNLSSNQVKSILGKPKSIITHKALEFDYIYRDGGVIQFKESRVVKWFPPE